MATLKDVARLACVDVSTVSRALNDFAYVHPETKARVMEAVRQLSYQPNLLAKGLRQGKRHTLGVVVPSIHMNIFGEITQRIEIEARKSGYGVMICNTRDDPEQERQSLNRLRGGFVDGIIIASTGQNGKLLRDIKAGGIAVAQLVRPQDKEISSVAANYYSCACHGVRYLVTKGCRNIAFINGDNHLSPYRERYLGYRDAVKEAGLTENVVRSSAPKGDSFADGVDGVDLLFDAGTKVDGIITALDMQGIGVIRALKQRGIPVPSQVRVMSLTGHSIGGMVETTMTSMEMPVRDIGREITAMVIGECEGGIQAARHIVLEPVLVVRETA